MIMIRPMGGGRADQIQADQRQTAVDGWIAVKRAARLSDGPAPGGQNLTLLAAALAEQGQTRTAQGPHFLSAVSRSILAGCLRSGMIQVKSLPELGVPAAS